MSALLEASPVWRLTSFMLKKNACKTKTGLKNTRKRIDKQQRLSLHKILAGVYETELNVLAVPNSLKQTKKKTNVELVPVQ